MKGITICLWHFLRFLNTNPPFIPPSPRETRADRERGKETKHKTDRLLLVQHRNLKDKVMFRYFTVLVLVISLLNGCKKSPQNSKEIKSLQQKLIENPVSIVELKDEISEEESSLSARLIHDYLSDKLREEYKDQWQNKTLEHGDYQLKFEYEKFGEKPPEGWSLFISMHGGGGAPSKVNDKQWQNQINLYQPAEGIYMAPRAPTNTWNLWHQEHIDVFFALFIQLADVFEDINTHRVYLTGYSAGGDGTYQLAPRMADWFAAAAMMAGHPNDASPLGLRNLPFAIHMGANDSAYNRNKIAAEWGKMLDSLQITDPGGYIHDVQIHKEMGHWMQRKDTVAIEWMQQFSRNPYPEKVVWKQSSVAHNRFYWSAVAAEHAIKDAEIVASLKGQTIHIEKTDRVSNLIINLNDKMVDLDKKVEVKYKGEVIYSTVPKRNISTIWESLNDRNDPEQYYTSQIVLTLSEE